MKIVIKRADGGIDITTLDAESIAKHGNEATEDRAISEWKAYYPGLYVSHREMPDEAIPPLDHIMREFRAAWTDTTPEPVIDICMVKARDIHLSRIRTARNTELSNLDIEAIRAQDAGNDVYLAQIRTKKQKLRDLPKTILPALENARTIEDLKTIWML